MENRQYAVPVTFSFRGLDIRHRLPDAKAREIRRIPCGMRIRTVGVSTPQNGACPSRNHDSGVVTDLQAPSGQSCGSPFLEIAIQLCPSFPNDEDKENAQCSYADPVGGDVLSTMPNTTTGANDPFYERRVGPVPGHDKRIGKVVTLAVRLGQRLRDGFHDAKCGVVNYGAAAPRWSKQPASWKELDRERRERVWQTVPPLTPRWVGHRPYPKHRGKGPGVETSGGVPVAEMDAAEECRASSAL